MDVERAGCPEMAETLRQQAAVSGGTLLKRSGVPPSPSSDRWRRWVRRSVRESANTALQWTGRGDRLDSEKRTAVKLCRYLVNAA